MKCPEAKAETKEAALRQSLNWLAAAAARKDLAPVFTDRWRLPLPPAARKALGEVDWSRADLDIAAAPTKLPVESRKERSTR